MTYRLRHVEPFEDQEAHDDLKELHRLIFGKLAPMPVFTEGNWWLVYDEKREAIGFAGLDLSMRFSDCGYLSRAGVLEAHRGHGLQQRMIRVRERKARELGYVWLYSDTTDGVVSANNLIKAGYRLYDPSAAYAFDNTNYWRKKLCPK